MRRHQSAPADSPSEGGSRPVSGSIVSSSSSMLEDDVFSVLSFKKNIDKNELFVSQVSDSSAVDGKTSSQVQDVDADAIANDNSVAKKRGRIYVGGKDVRFVFKDGVCNLSSRNVRKRRKRYLSDIFTTLIDMKWRYCFVMFAFAFVGSWGVFAHVWWLIAVVHGDDRPHRNSTSSEPCVAGVYDSLTALLFSVETQHTIGYGSRVIGPRCPQGILLLMCQACCGILIQSLMTGLVFAKLSRPKHRAHTMIFSRRAVVCLRNGEYCLLFRLGDMRSKHLVSTSIRALIVMDQRTDEQDETTPLGQSDFALETETNFDDSFVLLVWPTTFVHRIIPGSPLYTLCAKRLRLTDFEIVVILEGVLESTGDRIQVRTSYLQSEVLWGHRLAPLVTYEKRNGRYEIDFKRFHDVIPIASMPDYSAKEFDERSTERNDATVASTDEYPFSFTANDACRPASRTSLRRLVLRRCRSKTTEGEECMHGKASPGAAIPARKFGRQFSAEVL